MLTEVAFVFSGAEIAVAFVLLVCLPLFWIGFAWGMDSVRHPRAKWHRRVRWTWVVAIGLASGAILVPFAFVLIAAPFEREPVQFLAVGLSQFIVALGAPLVGCGVLPALGLALLTRRLARNSGNWCLRCGYDLRSSQSENCPECGAETNNARTHGAGLVEGQARATAVRYCLRGLSVVAVLAGLAMAGWVIFDCTVPAPVLTGMRCCEKCGAMESTRESPKWGVPLSPTRLYGFQASAGCSHQWVLPDQFLTSKCSTHLADATSGGAVLMEVANDPSDATRMTYVSIEPAAAGQSPPEFCIRWRAGPGALRAPDAKMARVEFIAPGFGGNYPMTLDIPLKISRCDPPELSGDVLKALSVPVAGTGGAKWTAGIVMLGSARTGDIESICRQDAFGERWSLNGGLTPAFGLLTSAPITSCVPIRDPTPGVRVAAVTAAEWEKIKTQDAPWPGVTLTRDVWDQFGPPAQRGPAVAAPIPEVDESPSRR